MGLHKRGGPPDRHGVASTRHRKHRLADLVRSAKEHLLSLSVALGIATLQELMEDGLTCSVGPKGKHRSDRAAYRHGSERRSVTLGRRLVEIERPRARTRERREL